jgi:hypothetical protein
MHPSHSGSSTFTGLHIRSSVGCPPSWLSGGENLQDVLSFPDKADQRAEPGTGWTPAELNHILHEHVVDCAVTTFGCVEWESQQFRGVMRARCYPFNEVQSAKEELPFLQPSGWLHFKYLVHTKHIPVHIQCILSMY